MSLRVGWIIMGAVVLTAGAAHMAGAAEPTNDLAEARPSEAGLAAGKIAPVHVIYPEDFLAQGYTTLPQVLANLVPAFVHPEPALADFTDHARPSSLRGLAPDQMVVLLDGKRRHPAAWLHRQDTYGRGSVGVDLSVIPLAAVKRVEILLDGASARYGSGAMGGVINVVLEDAAEGGSLVATFGQYRTHMGDVPEYSGFGVVSSSEFFIGESGDINTDDGEGDTLTVSAHGGFTLFDDGYIDLTGEFRDQDPTNRSGFDPRSIYPDLPNGDFDPREAFVDRRTYRYGNPEQEDVKLLANFGMPLTGRTDFYGHMGYTARNAESGDHFVLAHSDANVPAIHPDGYLPLLASDDESRYYTLGFRGRRWGWGWDLSYTQDEHEMDLEVSNSLNPSLGDISPTSFAVANFEGRHAIIALELARDFEVGLSGPLAFTGGLEYVSAEYENEFRDRGSYLSGGARTDDGTLRPPGSQGFYGVRPEDDFDDGLVDLAGWLQLEAPLMETVDTLLAVRYDDEEDWSTVSGKLGARWQATGRLSLHGAVSRNFRHPSPAQMYFESTEEVVAQDGYLDQGTYPADDPVARALGGEALEPETSVNVSGGLRFRAGEGAVLAVNVYRIHIDDRVVLSNWLTGDDVRAALDAAGFPGVSSVRYFFNGVDTRTSGVDVSGEYRWQSPWGDVALTAGFNLNDIDVTDAADTPAVLLPGAGTDQPRFGEREQSQLEAWTPDSKLHMAARWEGRRLAVDARISRYGEVTDVGATPDQDLDLGTQWLLDLNFEYRLTERGFAGLGIHNVLDEYTEVRPRGDSAPVLNRLLPYSNYAPYGFNGRFVYLRLGFDLDR